MDAILTRTLTDTVENCLNNKNVQHLLRPARSPDLKPMENVWIYLESSVAVGVARSVVARLWNRFQETGNVRRRPGAGRPPATTSTDDRYIQLTARRNRTENATQLQRQLLLATGRRISSQTVRNRLHEGGIYARKPMVCIPLTPRHRAARRRWAAKHLGAT
ncbi:transposable element Tcb2 transposase [Trichonephila clavipes]|uniref:Transposable element Tcb2 transposase n=1 Tax=Trichonephila clavipes TaxID=2585209 RepID=A0A8X6SSA9_TRICX|nr:transposable element Tcb2 transposase [Trichonephila clavipes]